MRYTPIRMHPDFLLRKKLLKYNTMNKEIATKIKDSTVYSIASELIRMKVDVLGPIIIVLMNHGSPKDSRMFIVLAPKALETPMEPSPAKNNFLKLKLKIKVRVKVKVSSFLK